MPLLRHLAWFATCGLALAQAQKSAFEPADFNVTEALQGYGIDVSAIEPAGGLEERSTEKGCRAAVRIGLESTVLSSLFNDAPV